MNHSPSTFLQRSDRPEFLDRSYDMRQQESACLLALGSRGRCGISPSGLSYFQNYIEPTVVVYKRLLSVREHLGTKRLAINTRLTDLEYCIHLIVSMLSCVSSQIEYQLALMCQEKGRAGIGDIARTLYTNFRVYRCWQ